MGSSTAEAVRPTMDGRGVWQPTRKTAEEGESVKAIYERFASKHDVQRERFDREYLKKLSDEEKQKMLNELKAYGLTLDFEKCHVMYLPEFKPIDLDYQLCYVRHGKTEGNTEPRIYQGFCDYWENQLNSTGKKQAIEAAEKMEQTMKDFTPDLILCSPLGRAIETGEAFYQNHPEIPCRIAYEAREQQFGSWDNIQLRYLDENDICHLFYLDQNALVKAPKPHVTADGKQHAAENFVELILRQAQFLKSVNQQPEIKQAKASGRKPNVLVYGHSMAGAAISALLGHGKKLPTGGIGFDGKYIMPNATPYMLFPRQPE